jgi:hypothetical protein
MSQFCASPAAFINRCCVTSAADAGSTMATMAIDANAARSPRSNMASLPIL